MVDKRKYNQIDEHGRKQGHWAERFDDHVSEGTYVNGERHGDWKEQHPEGRVEYSTWVHGIRVN